ncbi:unnamed protein product [Arabis nemorensis]|uniref:Methionyl-tRNA synthetase anticodon-binding domain-containing protein n=1 Tax=Arabis nemorensis TaxID=586526 RepID=A0A565AN07_9BRAS|nr:unnamed protein product [Arabis nemorensis]
MSLGGKVGKLVEEYVESMEKIKLKQGLKTAMRIKVEGNRYLQENQYLKLYKEDKFTCAIVIRSAAGLVHLLAQLLEPFMPSFSREVFKQLNLPPHFSLEVLQASRPWEILPRSHRIGTPQPLFEELKGEKVQRYNEKSDRDLKEAKASRRHRQKIAARIRRDAEGPGQLVERIRRLRREACSAETLGGDLDGGEHAARNRRHSEKLALANNLEEIRRERLEEACSSWNRKKSGGETVCVDWDRGGRIVVS